jgi:replicative DNA helicase
MQALSRAGHRCQVCNSPDKLDVHHRTYERVGQEQLDDLTVLCDRCHGLFHEHTTTTLRAVPVESAMNEWFEAVERRHDPNQLRSDLLSTGYVDLDEILVGLHPGELVIVTAATAVGKSAFLFNLARNIAYEGGNAILFASLEHNHSQLAEHLVMAAARVNGHAMRNGRLTQDEMGKLIDAAGLIRPAKLFIDDSARQSVLHIAASARRLKEEQSIRALFIDCLDLIEPDYPRDFRQEQLASMARRLKRLAKELQIPVVVSARLGRAIDDRPDSRPRLSDLRPVEQEADVVLILHTPAPYEPGAAAGVAEVFVGKQRNGPTGEITLAYIKQFMRFDNFAVGTSFES